MKQVENHIKVDRLYIPLSLFFIFQQGPYDVFCIYILLTLLYDLWYKNQCLLWYVDGNISYSIILYNIPKDVLLALEATCENCAKICVDEIYNYNPVMLLKYQLEFTKKKMLS